MDFKFIRISNPPFGYVFFQKIFKIYILINTILDREEREKRREREEREERDVWICQITPILELFEIPSFCS